MDGYVRGIHGVGRYRRVASVAISYVCLLCCMPLDGVCSLGGEPTGSQGIASDLLIQVENQNADGVIAVMDHLDDALSASADPLAEGRKFLQTFLRELNAKYGLSLTIQDACKCVRENFHMMGLPEESREAVLAVIALYESDEVPSTVQQEEGVIPEQEPSPVAMMATPFTPAILSLFCKKKKNKAKNRPRPQPVLAMSNELPSDCYVGGAELLAGSLLYVAGFMGLPGAFYLGSAFLADGGWRLMQGNVQLGEEKRNDPNFIPPAFPDIEVNK